jgi:cytosine/adenosine deaminase-related metal-dependent hydrolase
VEAGTALHPSGIQPQRDIEGGDIRANAPHRLPTEGPVLVECGGRVVTPGMIDAHTHICCASINIAWAIAPSDLYRSLCVNILEACARLGFQDHSGRRRRGDRCNAPP